MSHYKDHDTDYQAKKAYDSNYDNPIWCAIEDLEYRIEILESQNPRTTLPSQKSNTKANLTEADLEDIKWFIKGMKPAPEDTVFKFTFAKNLNEELIEAIKPLYREIQLYGSVTIGPYEYKISGKEGSLISARLVE